MLCNILETEVQRKRFTVVTLVLFVDGTFLHAFPSAINQFALTFSCKTYGDRTLLTEALSVQCLVLWMVFVLVCPA